MRLTSSVVASFVAVLCLATSAQAERADRTRPMVIDSDGKQAATVDLNRKVSVLSGNVVITQGTLQVKAEKVEIREEAPGRYQATARGAEGRPATFRQKRDRLDEYVEADAERIEYDGNAERVRFIGNAHLRILRGGTVGDEASAATIIYDQRGDTLTFEGGGPTSAGGTPGRARLVFVPRESPASEPAAGGAK